MNNALLSRLSSLSTGQKLTAAVTISIATTLLATPLRDMLALANIVMLFLLSVLVVAAGLGRGPGVLAAFLSVVLFDVFFVPPRYSLAVEDAQYLVTFSVMLATALLTAQLAAGLRRQAELAAASEAQARALYSMARELAGALTTAQVADTARQFLRGTGAVDGSILVPDTTGTLVPLIAGEAGPGVDPIMARLAYEGGMVIDTGPSDGGNFASAFFPLQAPMRVRGVLAVRPLEPARGIDHELRQLIETTASLIGIALERLHYVDVAQRTQLEVAAERLRNSILSALSHDLRTPLTVLVGLTDSLALSSPPLPAAALETAQRLRLHAVRLTGLVGNLLDMARLQSGQVTLRKEWQPVEEVIGSAIKLPGSALDAHPVHVDLAPDLPLLALDSVLMERVLFNLLDNAAKYSSPGTPIDIFVRRQDDDVVLEVCDRGSGFPPDKSGLFTMFVRGEAAAAKPGVGLGLAICRVIVEAHQGSMEAIDRAGGGACVRIVLPIGRPPSVEDEKALADGVP